MRAYPIVKRVLDVAASGGGILLLSPVRVTIAIVLKLTGEHDVFYG